MTWDGEQEYDAIVFCDEGGYALPWAMFIHHDEAVAYLLQLREKHPDLCFKLQVRTLSRRTTTAMRPGKIDGTWKEPHKD